MRKIANIVFIVLFFAILAMIFFPIVDYHIKNVNNKYYIGDQQNYINFAKRINSEYLGDRNRMPVYPFIQSLFYKQDMGDEDFFMQGKYINAVLSFCILILLFFIFLKHFNIFYSINLCLVLTFTIFIFKAGYFQCEILFYFLNFLSFLIMLYLLINPDWRLAFACGIITGVSYLTKASALPALLLFLVFIAIRFSFFLFRYLSERHNISYKVSFSRNLKCFILVIVTFLLTIHWYALDNKRIFGKYLYNVNSTFYFWYDSWEEAEGGVRLYGDNEGYPNMPLDQIPSMRKYFAEHSIQEIFHRIIFGIFIVMTKAVKSQSGWFKYCYIYMSAAILLVILNFNKAKTDFKKYFSAIFYIFAYLASYALLYGWYAPVSRAHWPLFYGDRLILSLVIPFLFAISVLITRYSKENFIVYHEGKKINFEFLFNILILYLMLPDFLLLTKRAMVTFSGK